MIKYFYYCFVQKSLCNYFYFHLILTRFFFLFLYSFLLILNLLPHHSYFKKVQMIIYSHFYQIYVFLIVCQHIYYLKTNICFLFFYYLFAKIFAVKKYRFNSALANVFFHYLKTFFYCIIHHQNFNHLKSKSPLMKCYF